MFFLYIFYINILLTPQPINYSTTSFFSSITLLSLGFILFASQAGQTIAKGILTGIGIGIGKHTVDTVIGAVTDSKVTGDSPSGKSNTGNTENSNSGDSNSDNSNSGNSNSGDSKDSS